MNKIWRQRELVLLVLYAVIFYIIVIRSSLQLSNDHYKKLYGLRPGLISSQVNDISDAQWRNFRSNLPILTFVFGLFILIANTLRAFYNLKAEGMSVVWLLISLAYLAYLHGALYLDEQNTSHLYFGCSTYLFFFVTVFMRDTHSLVLARRDWCLGERLGVGLGEIAWLGVERWAKARVWGVGLGEIECLGVERKV